MDAVSGDACKLTLEDNTGNRIQLIDNIQQEVRSAIGDLVSEWDILTAKYVTMGCLERVDHDLEKIKASFKEEESAVSRTVGKVNQGELTRWERLGEGGFSSVFKAKLKGNDVAVKVLKNLKEARPLLTEENLLRDLRHDNIVAFGGMNILECDVKHEKFTLKAGCPFLVMEYIPKNLYRFVEDHKTPESQGLPKSQVWTIGKGIANGLMYLHTLNPSISHGDLKPDNILLDIRSPRVKLADFGLSRPVEHVGSDLSLVHARWAAPEVLHEYIEEEFWEDAETEEQLSQENDTDVLNDEMFHLRADIYSYGQVMAYTLTGKMPWQGLDSLSVKGIHNLIQKDNRVEIPEHFSGQLKDVIEDCRLEEPEKRPTAETLVMYYYSEEDFLSDESEKFWVNIPGGYEEKKLTHFVQAAKNQCPTEMQQGNVEKFLCRIWKLDYGQLAGNDSYVTLNDFLVLVALFGPFKPGPDGCLQKMYDLMKKSLSTRRGKKESWFAGNMDETEAANLLSDLSPGHFLIRISSSRPHEGLFVLAVKTSDNGVVQIQIERDLQDNTLLLADQKFADLMSIVEALRDDVLLENCRQLLTNPCPGLPLNALFTGHGKATGRRGAGGRGKHLRSELLFVTSAHDNFDNTGGKLTHPDSDVCINIEPGTFPDGKQQLFFHVIYNDKDVIQDIPETNERTLISPVIKCEPDDINPQKAVEIVLPHCLYVDEVNKGSIEVYRCGQFINEGPQTWEVIPSSSESSCHSKAWFSINEDSIVIKTKVFSIWSVFVCGVGGSMRKRVTAFASKPNPEGNLISLRCYIYSDNEDSKKKVERLENEHFPRNKRAATEKPFKLFNDDQDITVWLDKDALTAKGWMLDEIPASQIYNYEMAYRNGFRSIYACEFPVKPIGNCLTGVDDFSCVLHFQQIGHAKDYIYVNPGIPLLPLQRNLDVNGSNSDEAQSQHPSSQASTPDSCSPGLVVPEDLPGRFDEPVTQQDCIRLCHHIVKDWKMILRHLGVEEAVLDNVDANHSRANEKSFQGLLEWIRSAGAQGATMRKLCNALRAVNCTEALEILSSRDDGARQPAHAIPETV